MRLINKLSLVDAEADDDLEVLLIPPERLRALIVAEAELGERIVRALILRRVAHIESRGSGPVLIGQMQSPDMLRLENFLRRNGQPHNAMDPSQDAAAAALFAQYGGDAHDVLVACPNGSMHFGQRSKPRESPQSMRFKLPTITTRAKST